MITEKTKTRMGIAALFSLGWLAVLQVGDFFGDQIQISGSDAMGVFVAYLSVMGALCGAILNTHTVTSRRVFKSIFYLVAALGLIRIAWLSHDYLRLGSDLIMAIAFLCIGYFFSWGMENILNKRRI